MILLREANKVSKDERFDKVHIGPTHRDGDNYRWAAQGQISRTGLTLDYTQGCRFMERRQSNADWRGREKSRIECGRDSVLRAQRSLASGTPNRRWFSAIRRRA